jgi:putative addiction module component (TIGR02574 family)
MSRAAAELLNEALKLPTEARAALADSLLDSLDIEVDEDAEQAWRQEIHQRLQEIGNGAVELIPWPDAQRRLQSRLKR